MINKTLKNRYEILEKIGEGGTSKIYKAKCKLLNRYVAIKILKDEFLEDEEFLKNFKNESRSAASISHPNIVNIYDVGEEKNIHFIVMEYVEGMTLKDYIKKEGKVELEKALDIIKQIALALDKAHKNSIIHRDIKPENILISNENLVKILDFGIAKAVTKSTVINKKEIIGSIYYLSPEQVKGQIVDEGADIYALGIVLYEMLTGILPFSGNTPVDIALKHINEEVDLDKLGNYSFEIKEFVAKMTNKNRMKRYNKAKDVVSDLENIKKGRRISNQNSSDFNTKKMDDIDFKKILDKEDNKKNNTGEIDLKSVLTKNTKEKKIKSKNKRQAILGGILAFFISILFAFGFIFIKNMVTKKEYKTPDMTNLRFEEAKDILTQKNIFLVKRREEYNKDVIKDNIISQKPSPGTIIKEGDEITVVISLGMPLTKVPSFKGKKLVDASKVLKESNLDEGLVDYEYSNIVSEGVIISQNPQAFTKVQEGSSVNFIVSQGREIKIINVPNLIGKTIDQAKMNLKGIYLGKIDYKEDREKEEGVILKQSLPSNTSAEEGSKIDIVVNRFEEIQEESVLTDDTKEENDLTDLVKKSFTIPLSTDKDEIHVFIKEIKNNKEKIIYNKKVNPKQVDNILYINVKGKPGETKKYEIYLDESLYFDPVVSF